MKDYLSSTFVVSVAPVAALSEALYNGNTWQMLAWLVVWFVAVSIVTSEKQK